MPCKIPRDLLAPLTPRSSPLQVPHGLMAPDLAAVLDNREARGARQAALRARHGTTIITCSVNMPGPIKDNLAARRVLAAMVRTVHGVLHQGGWFKVALELRMAPTGPEALFAVWVDARMCKAALIDAEEHHPMGRLFDLDVHDAAGQPVSRADLQLPPRTCLVCGEVGAVCARSRRHGLWAVLEKVRQVAASRAVREK